MSWFYSVFETMYNWFFAFAEGMSNMWEWLITPISFLSLNVRPIYAVVGSVAIFGILRRLF